MSPADRELVINRLRLVAYQWYADERVTATQFWHGICGAAQRVDVVRERSWYPLMGDAFELLGMDRNDPFDDEEHGDSGDWTVRPLFCLLMADALEQME